MLHQIYNPIQEYETSTSKNEYEYLCKKDDELKGDNNTIENEGLVEYDKDFTICMNIHSKHKNLSNLSNKNIHYYLKLQIPILHRK